MTVIRKITFAIDVSCSQVVHIRMPLTSGDVRDFVTQQKAVKVYVE